MTRYIKNKIMTNGQEQTLISAIIGDGRLDENGWGSYSSIHQEYLEFKNKLLGGISDPPKKIINEGYKKSPIYTLYLPKNKIAEDMAAKTLKEVVGSLDELGIAMWLFDDGSRHKKHNFFNINTHSFDREVQELVFIPKLNEFDIFPEVYTETKKDGRVFNYLYISKWNGAMEMSRIMRKCDLKCFDYKLVPEELEKAYFKVKDTKHWKSLKHARGKTNYIKKNLKMDQQEGFAERYPGARHVNSDEIFKNKTKNGL